MATLTADDGLAARPGGSWTANKLFYLRRYSEAFTKAMRGKWEALVYIDLLAGPGKDIDRKSGDEFLGSPLIALETRPPFDRVYLGDLDAANVNALRHRISPEDAARVDLECGDCHERAIRVVSELTSRTLGLAFVDPEGFEVRFALLEMFAQRAIDIVMLFPSGIGINRNIPIFARAEDAPMMDALWGGPMWREIPIVKAYAGRALSAADMERLQTSWVSEYRARVATLGCLHSDSIGPLRNDRGAPMYHLLFFSRHEIGLTIWHGIRELKPDGRRWFKGFIR